jgi:hypothetical protein
MGRDVRFVPKADIGHFIPLSVGGSEIRADPPVNCKEVPRANRTVGHDGAGQADAMN